MNINHKNKKMKTTLIDRIMKVLSDHNIADTDYCKKIGIQSQVITAWKNGTRPVADKYVLKTIELFDDIDARWLITGERDKNIDEAMKLKDEIDKREKLINDRILKNERDLDVLRRKLNEKQDKIEILFGEILQVQREREGLITNRGEAKKKEQLPEEKA